MVAFPVGPLKDSKSNMSVVCQKQSVRDGAAQSGSARKVERFSVLGDCRSGLGCGFVLSSKNQINV